MKKIVHIVESTATGTLAMVSIGVNFHVSKGYSVKVIYSRRQETPLDLNEYFHSTVEMIEIPMKGWGRVINSIFKIRKILKENIDILFLHSSYAGFIGRIASLGLSHALKIYYIPHCISFAREDIGRFKKLILVALETIASLKKSVFLACSESEAMLIKKYIPYRQCYILENAIIKNKYLNIKNIKNFKQRHIIITVGGIRPQKGVEDYLYIVENVKLMRNDVDFVWVGDGDIDLKKELISKGVFVTGWCKEADVGSFLNKSDIYLSCSLWEGMPVAVIEAMSMRLPVVVSDCRGNSDVVRHMNTGFIFQETNNAIKIIDTILSDKESVANIVESAYVESITRFSSDRYVRELDEFI